MKFRIKWFFYSIYWHVRYWKCDIFDHDWEEEGGRSCPKDVMEFSDCYQPIYCCQRCGEEDFGDKGGPGWQQCHIDCFLPEKEVGK